MSADARTRARPICMIVHSYYDEDPRVRREAESLVLRGREVDVVGLRRPGESADAVIDGVSVHRIDVQRHQGAGLGTYLTEYLRFLVLAGWHVARRHRRRRYALVQVHTLPDFLVVAALPLRLAGVPVILDLHEAMPEFFRMRFPRSSSPVLHRLLVLQERISIALASAVITVNDALADRLVGLGVPAGKVTVVMNAPSTARFDPARHPTRAFMADGTLRLVYAGALTPTYELDVAIEAVARLRSLRPNLPVQLELFGRGDSEPALRARAADLALDDQVTFHGRVPIEDVAAAIAGADIGLAPTRRDPFTDYSLSTKIFEYAAMGKPVVASRLPMVERTFRDDAIRTYTAGDAGALAAAIVAIVDGPDAREVALVRAREVLEAQSWERQSDRLWDLVERLAPDGISSSERTTRTEDS